MKSKNVTVDQIIDMLKESFSLVKLYKIFIVFGIIFALFGGTMVRVGFNASGSSGFNANYNRSSTNNRNSNGEDYRFFDNSYVNDGIDKVKEVPWGTILLVSGAICCLGIVWGVVRLYVRNVSNNVLIGAVDLVEQKSDLKFSSLWKYGHAVVLKTIALDIIYAVVSFFVVLFSIPLIFCCGLGILTMFLGTLALSILLDMSKRFLILKDRSIVDSIKDAYELIKNNIVNFIVYIVTLFVLAFFYGVASLIIAIPLLIVLLPILAVLVVPTILLIVAVPILGWILFVLAIIVFIVLMVLIGSVIYGPVLAIIEVWKTKYWKLVTSNRELIK